MLLDFYKKYKKKCIQLGKATYFDSNRDFNLHLIFLIVLVKIKNDALVDRANSIAFNLTLSIFPFVIFLFTLIPYFQIDHLEEDLFAQLDAILPAAIHSFVTTTIYDIINRPRSGLLSFGFIATLYTATNGIVAFMDAFNRSYRIKEKRNFLYKRLLATFLTFLLTVFLILTTVLLVVGSFILDKLIETGWLSQDFLYYSIQALRFVVSFLILFLSISILYYLAPAQKISWRRFSLGAILATTLCMLASILFSYYISYFNTYNKLYGSIGTVIGFMFWLFVISLMILVGFELNVSIEKARKIANRKKMQRIRYQKGSARP
jgi:membrane protein